VREISLCQVIINKEVLIFMIKHILKFKKMQIINKIAQRMLRGNR
jgi:hypothetical protein